MKRNRLLLVIGLIAGMAGGCSIPPDRPAAERKVSPAAVAKPADHSRRFSPEGRVKVDVVDNHLMDKEFMPGGNVAEYQKDGKAYRQFLAEVKDPQAAGLLLYDYKSTLSDSKYLAHMGGYFGQDGSEPVLVFQKGRFVAGIAGLPEKEADLIARELAARLN
jgi:hypothetical protein